MAKDQIRAIGIDDAPFDFSEEKVMVIGSVVRAPNYLEGILSSKVQVDGNDATEKLSEMISESRFSDQANVLFIDGAAVGGFNLIDFEELSESTKIPSISISRKEPDFEKIELALQHHFERWDKKLEILKKGKIYEIETEYKSIYIQKEGLDIKEARKMIEDFTVRGRLPEPIRISHMVASGVVKGESKGKV